MWEEVSSRRSRLAGCERVPGPAVVREAWAFLSTDSGACGTQRDSACGTSRSSSPAPHPASPEATRDLNF